MIKGSIRYAQTIQQAILPDLKQIKAIFDNFVLFRPKDIVSGDFYWFTKVADYYYIAVVDCTGHGVPGAFMSMIASRILNEIVLQNTNISPAEILTNLNDAILIALKQKETKNMDGMDVCLVRIEKNVDDKKIIFCGAKRDLIYYNSDTNSIEISKGDRRSIGGVSERKTPVNFTNTELILKKDSILYLSSDGLSDQNNLERKRFGSNRLIKIISENFEKPLTEQKYIIEKEIDTWQTGVEQRDDITFMAIKI